MSRIGDVEYSPPAYRLMRQFAEQVMGCTDEAERKELLREAEVIHVFHEEFPGVVMHDPEGGGKANGLGSKNEERPRQDETLQLAV